MAFALASVESPRHYPTVELVRYRPVESRPRPAISRPVVQRRSNRGGRFLEALATLLLTALGLTAFALATMRERRRQEE